VWAISVRMGPACEASVGELAEIALAAVARWKLWAGDATVCIASWISPARFFSWVCEGAHCPVVASRLRAGADLEIVHAKLIRLVLRFGKLSKARIFLVITVEHVQLYIGTKHALQCSHNLTGPL